MEKQVLIKYAAIAAGAGLSLYCLAKLVARAIDALGLHSPYGLPNKGQTCHLNVALQCLASSPTIIQFLTTNNLINTTSNRSDSDDAVALLSNLHAGRSDTGVQYRGLSSILSQTRINRAEQCDVMESLERVLSTLFLSSSSSSSSSACSSGTITPPFMFSLDYTTTCSECGHASTNSTPQPILSMPLASNTLAGLMEATFAKEMISGYRCESQTCQHSPRLVWRQASIREWPKVLFLHVQRASFGMLSKRTSHVHFGIRMVFGTDLHSTTPSEQHVYRLVGVGAHLGGSAEAGHYVFYRWLDAAPSSSTTSSSTTAMGGQWMRISDSYVEHDVPEEVVLGVEATIWVYEQVETER
jgi:ubiquitin C-terminal hydrolase